MPLIQDSHCHPLRTLLNPTQFEQLWLDSQIHKMVFCTTHPSEWPKAIEYAKGLKKIEATLQLGIHPWWAEPYSNKELLQKHILELEHLISDNPNLHIGECGLDANIKKKAPLDLQEQVLISQLQLAHKYKRKVNLHCVKATGRLQSLISKYPKLDFTLHSYKGSKESTQIWIKLGARFSLGSRSFDWENLNDKSHKQHSTFKALQKLYKNEPNRIGFESDAPDAGDAQTPSALYTLWNEIN